MNDLIGQSLPKARAGVPIEIAGATKRYVSTRGGEGHALADPGAISTRGGARPPGHAAGGAERDGRG